LAQEELERTVKLDVEARVREGVKTILEEILEEEMTEHIGAGHPETTSKRKGERNGHYRRNLVTGAGKIERLEVPRDREGEFVTEVFERYKRLTGSVEEAILEMYLSGVSTRKIAGITEALSRVRIGKDTLSRITSRLREQQKAWRERPLEKDYPYLYLDATYLKVNWGAGVTSLALLSAVGVNAEGYREVLAVEVAGGEKSAAYASLLRGLIDRGLSGVRLVVSDDHEGIKAAVAGELPGVDWQRCVAHFMGNVLAHVPASAMGEVAEDLLKAIFKVRREKTAWALAEEFIELHGERYPKAISVFEAGIGSALTYPLRYPGSHHARVRTTNALERLYKEVKRRTKVVGVFPNETSASTLATEIMLRSSEEWALKRYLNMEALKAVEKPNPQYSRR
jgi:putative transposase